METTFTRNWAGPGPQGGTVRISREEQSARERALQQAPLFAGFPKRHLRAIAREATVTVYDRGETIVEEGSKGGAFFVILDGSAKAVSGSRTLGRLKPGTFFGEVALLDEGPRMASVVTESMTRCLILDGQDFQRIVAKEPALALRLLRELARRLRMAERPKIC